MSRLTVPEVAEQLKVTELRTVRRWFVSGDLRGSKVGRQWLTTQEDVDAFVESRANRPADRRRRRRAA